jgi:hypothetical protein
MPSHKKKWNNVSRISGLISYSHSLPSVSSPWFQRKQLFNAGWLWNKRKRRNKNMTFISIETFIYNTSHVPDILMLSVTELTYKSWSTAVIFNNLLFERGQ